jgi:hypothetical protein
MRHHTRGTARWSVDLVHTVAPDQCFEGEAGAAVAPTFLRAVGARYIVRAGAMHLTEDETRW